MQASSTERCPDFGYCSVEAFNRDEAIRRAGEKLARAEERVGEAEELARQAGMPDRCLVDPSD